MSNAANYSEYNRILKARSILIFPSMLYQTSINCGETKTKKIKYFRN